MWWPDLMAIPCHVASLMESLNQTWKCTIEDGVARSYGSRLVTSLMESLKQTWRYRTKNVNAKFYGSCLPRSFSDGESKADLEVWNQGCGGRILRQFSATRALSDGDSKTDLEV